MLTRDEHELFAQPRRGLRPDDCYFYHTIDVPGLGVIPGPWDLRGHESEYLGGVRIAGARVLEIGPASGFFTMTLEAAGAAVVAVDTDPDAPWDLVPQAALDPVKVFAERKAVMERVRNSWWLVHERFGLKAQVHYGHGARLPEALGNFDVAVLAAVLLHCRHPLDVLEAAAARAGTVVVTDLAYPALTGPVCQLAPSRGNGMTDAWWMLTPGLVIQYLEVLGFTNSTVTYHSQLLEGVPTAFFTVVAD